MQQQYAVFSKEELLQFATSNGAAALQMPHLGQISKGFTPGILHICNWVLKEEMPIQPIIKRVI
jgi:imidazolonepropionase-like amidohydrolase